MLDGLQEWFGSGNGNETILRLLGWLWSRIVVNGATWVGEAAGASFAPGNGAVSILVSLPRSMTLGEPWVVAGHALLSRVAGAALVGGFLLALLAAATGGLLGFTTTEAKGVLAVSVLVWYANRRALELVGYLLDLSNALAAQFADPTELLPGWDTLSDLQRGSGEGMMLFAAGVAGLFLSLVRWFTLLGVNILIVLMPLALLCALHPATRSLFSLWWRSLLGLVFVQVPMALAIGQGQALIGRYGAGSGGGALVAGIACFWLASKMPGMVGGVARMGAQAGVAPLAVAVRAGRSALGLPATPAVRAMASLPVPGPPPSSPSSAMRSGPLEPVSLAAYRARRVAA